MEEVTLATVSRWDKEHCRNSIEVWCKIMLRKIVILQALFETKFQENINIGKEYFDKEQ
jgi:hypothetical protein